MQAKVARLEHLTGHKFQDLKLLERAVTHRSWAYENLKDETESEIRLRENESLEFIGDSVIGLIVAEQLILRNPTANEGDLTLMKHSLVSGPTLASIADEIDLGEYLRLGGSEIKTGRTKERLLGNAFEAVIGAVFLDGGYVATRHVVMRLMEQRLREARPETSVDFKSRLQTELQARKQTAAAYSLKRSEGPPHDRKFYVEVVWDDGRADGVGNSIKAAEMVAASAALEKIEDESQNKSDK